MIHVLIVEDHEQNRDLVKILLEMNGYRVTAAGNGVEALAAARRDAPDVVISDVLMPKMDGFALCRAWMQDVKLKSVPFIFYSATYVHPDDEHLALALGAVRYLIKPLEAEVFLAELRAALKQWAGRAAPTPAAPLDDATARALHEAALGRKVDDKLEQLETANRKLREIEEKYQRIYDSVQDVYVEASWDGTILEMSPQVATLSRGQYKREDLIGTSVNALYADTQYRTAILQAIKQRGRAIDVDSMFKNRDGSLVPCSVSAMIVRGSDGELRTVATLRDISRRKCAEDETKRYVAQLENALVSTVQVVTTLGEMRDPNTAGHQSRVAEIAAALGAELGFDLSRQGGLRVAGCLHDIGNIRVPPEILSKPGKLSAAELQLVQGHAQAGHDLLKGVKFPWPMAEVALQHHERMDGSGYPQGLKGDAILLEARIIAVADVIEAMTSPRPYRAALSVEKALTEIERGRGSAYDADVADACLRVFVGETQH